ncbi:MAG: carboxypeptidase regulatory-like domain-containing protein [Longimicrobiales bacterium]
MQRPDHQRMRPGSLGQWAGAGLIAGLALLAGPAPSRAQDITVQGRVLEQGTGDPIAGASVELAGAPRVLTNRNGLFAFPNVRAGSHSLVVNMLGYHRRQLTIDVQRDTTLVIELTVEAVRVDSLTVRARNVTLRGQVTDSASRLPIMDAEIMVGRARAVLANSMGRFRANRIPAHQPTTVLVRALGYLPMQLSVTPARDTTINFALQLDPVGQRMIAAQIQRLEDRAKKMPFLNTTMTRAELMERHYNWTAADAIAYRTRSSGRQIMCVYIDNVFQSAGLAPLNMYVPDEIERIEFIDRGSMVRVYTRGYIQQMMRGRVQLYPIVFVKDLGPKGCM